MSQTPINISPQIGLDQQGNLRTHPSLDNQFEEFSQGYQIYMSSHVGLKELLIKC